MTSKKLGSWKANVQDSRNHQISRGSPRGKVGGGGENGGQNKAERPPNLAESSAGHKTHCLCVQRCRAICWGMGGLSGSAFLNKNFSLPQQPSLSNSSSDRGGTSRAPPSFRLWFWLAWSPAGPVHMVTAFWEFICTAVPSCPASTVFHRRPLWLIQCFCPIFCDGPQTLSGRDMIELSYLEIAPTVSHSLHVDQL